ncbi:hypothetical protein C8R43DRAFT_948337 [Mycena crocata]|nr:hypothetical protein C8R43DRAFT_948337 [Mycena crocata]
MTRTTAIPPVHILDEVELDRPRILKIGTKDGKPADALGTNNGVYLTFVTSLLRLGARKFVNLIEICESSSHGENSGKARHFHQILGANAGHLDCLSSCFRGEMYMLRLERQLEVASESGQLPLYLTPVASFNHDGEHNNQARSFQSPASRARQREIFFRVDIREQDERAILLSEVLLACRGLEQLTRRMEQMASWQLAREVRR